MPAYVAITEPKAIDERLAKVSIWLRRTIARKAVQRGGDVVKRRLKQIIPQSRKTGSRKHWSKSTRDARAGVKPHVETIGLVVRDYGSHLVAIVGAQYPAGALSHVIEKDREMILWGKPSGMIITGDEYTERAADETVNEQRSVIESTVQSEVAKLLSS